jgi:hypothetical protein
MGMRQKAGTGVGVLGLAQGFASMALSNHSGTLSKWFLLGFAVCMVAALALFFWPTKPDSIGEAPSANAKQKAGKESTQTQTTTAAEQSGSGTQFAGNTTIENLITGLIPHEPPAEQTPTNPKGYTWNDMLVADALLKFSRKVSGWAREMDRGWRAYALSPSQEERAKFSAYIEETFAERFLKEFQALYGELAARGFPSDTLERLYDGPHNISQAREIAEEMSRYAQRRVSEIPREVRDEHKDE